MSKGEISFREEFDKVKARINILEKENRGQYNKDVDKNKELKYWADLMMEC